MLINVVIPNLGESITEALLIRWVKNDGESVAKGEFVAELETDKVNVELPALAAGTLHHRKPAGTQVAIGETVAQIDASANSAAAPKAAQPVATAAADRTPATASVTASSKPEDLSPAVRVLAEETRVDPRSVTGTGRGGRVTKDDMVRHLSGSTIHGNGGPPPQAQTAPPVAPIAKAPAPPAVPPSVEPQPDFDANGLKRVPMTKMRSRIAKNLVLAQQTAAILTTFNEVDLTTIMALRSKYKDRFQEAYGVGLGFMSFFARAVVLALQQFPRVNAMIDGEDIVYHNFVNLGIAVSTDRGLAVPVLRNAEQMSFARIEAEVKRLAGATREGKLGLAELSGGTFTITNGGVFGSLLSTPILNPPQSGILGMHAIQKRPIAVGDKVEIHPMMYVALSYDHRVVDGRESVSFLVRLKEFLEDPARLMLEI